MVRAIVSEGSPGGGSETTGVVFVKQVGFKPKVKERERVMDEQSGESEEEEVMGEGIGESEMEKSSTGMHIVVFCMLEKRCIFTVWWTMGIDCSYDISRA